jgi:hypothetical protein
VAAAAVVAALAITQPSALPVFPSDEDPAARALVETFPPAPANLRVYDVGKDYAKVTFGPAIVGPLVPTAAAPNGRSLTVVWGATADALYSSGPFTYDVWKNDKLILHDVAQTFAKIGFTLRVRTFKLCVTPHSPSGFGPQRCTTFTGA